MQSSGSPEGEESDEELKGERAKLETSLAVARKSLVEWESKYNAQVESSTQLQEQLHRLRAKFHVVSRVPVSNDIGPRLLQTSIDHNLSLLSNPSNATWPTDSSGSSNIKDSKQVTDTSDEKVKRANSSQDNVTNDDSSSPGEDEQAAVQSAKRKKTKYGDDKLQTGVVHKLDRTILLEEAPNKVEFQLQQTSSTMDSEEFEGKPDGDLGVDGQES
eukprot:scaffold30021_cov54-Attheya_sp.AAC.3